MDIAAVSSALSAVGSYGISSIGSVPQVASMEMLGKAMETNETMGAQMIKMMEQSVTPHLGQHFDMTV